jgi:hypothetical protein
MPPMRTTAILAVALASGALAQEPAETAPVLPRLAEPFVVEADGAPIEVTTGHAAPFLVDLDGDGLRDLVVGQYDAGQARVYRNHGTKTVPRFEDFAWLEAAGEPASVPPS